MLVGKNTTIRQSRGTDAPHQTSPLAICSQSEQSRPDTPRILFVIVTGFVETETRTIPVPFTGPDKRLENGLTGRDKFEIRTHL